MDSNSAQWQDLVHIHELQQRVSGPFVRIAKAGTGEQAPDDVYEEMFAGMRAHLSAVERYNAQWPATPMELQPIASPLVQHMSILADYLSARGERERAETLRDEVVELTGRYLDARAAAVVEMDLGMTRAMQGRFHEALLTLEDARRTLIELGAMAPALKATLKLANIYEWLGDYERGLDALNDVSEQLARLSGTRPENDSVFDALMRQMNAIEQGEDDGSAGMDLLMIQQAFDEMLQAKGRLARLTGDLVTAERCFRQVRPHLEAGGLAPGVDFHLAKIEVERHRPQAAADLLAQIEPFFAEPLVRPRVPALRVLQADAALGLGDPGTALSLTEDGIKRLEQHPDGDLAWKLNWRKARALQAAGDRTKALAAFLDAAAAADQLRKGPLGYRLDTTFFRDKAPMFDAAINLSLDLNDPGATARLVELVKSRALSAALSVPAGSRGARSGEEKLFDDLSTRLDALDFQIQTEGQSAQLGHEREAVLAEREAVLERIRLSDQRWRSLSVPALHSPEETAALAGPHDQAVISLLYRPDRIITVLYQRGTVTTGTVALSDATRLAIEEYAENVRIGQKPFQYDVSQDAGVKFEDFVPAALATQALTASSLIVVPHGVLHLLPWPALISGERRLFEITEVGVLPNVSCLHVLAGEPPAKPKAAILGNPSYEGLSDVPELPAAGPEVADVAALYSGRLLTEPITGQAATEAAFWGLWDLDGKDAILHVTSHGVNAT